MTSESNQHDEKRFGPKLSSFKKSDKKPEHAPAHTRSYSPIANTHHARAEHAGTTHHTAEHPDKKLVFVRKSKSNFSHSKNRPAPKKGASMRKVTSEAEQRKEHVIPALAEGVIR